MTEHAYAVRTFGFRGSWGQIYRIEEGFRRIGCRIASEGDAFDFIYSNELLQDRGAIALKARTGKPLIRHIHDLPALEGTPGERGTDVLRAHRQAILDSSDAITTNTRFVAGQLARYWDYRDAIITGQPIQFDPDLANFRARPRRNRAVMVGRLADPLKNAELVISALAQLRAPPDLAMVWVGKAKKKPRGLFRRFRIEHYEEIAPSALAALMRDSRMLLAPSLFEGLGLPPIEALALGTPAIVSDIPVKREVFAGIPMLFHDPHDPASLARAIETLLEDEAAGWAMVESFAPQLAFYLPETIAAKIVAAYEGLSSACDARVAPA